MGKDLKVAIEALRHDAKKWKELADAMAKAKGEIAGLTVSEFAFGYLAGKSGITTMYETERAAMESWADQAIKKFNERCDELNKAADAYEKNENHISKSLHDAWHL